MNNLKHITRKLTMEIFSVKRSEMKDIEPYSSFNEHSWYDEKKYQSF